MAGPVCADHKERILRVLFHIQDNLDNALDLDGLAALAAMSPYHFHRVFKGMVGETVMEHVRRLRLERAALALSCSRQPVTRVAFEAGYETVESFSRAFKARFGVPPSRFAEARFGGLAENQEELAARLAHNIKEGKTKNVEFRTIEPMKIVYARGTGPYFESAKEAWEKLVQWPGFGAAMARPGAKCIGIGHDDPTVTPPEKIRYDAAVNVNAEPQVSGEIHQGEIPGGEYGVYLHVGPYEKLESVYHGLYGQWLPASGRELRPCCGFEVYLNSPESTPPEELQTEIWIPLA